jgi:uncharacterized membrane protein HdeD (DUF308 family)
MDDLLQRSWWMLALRGAAAIVFGILAIMWPGITLMVLVALFAAYAVVSGIFTIIAAVQNRKSDQGWWMLLLLGIVSVAAGVVAVVFPGITALVLVLLMGANALVTGVLDMAIAIRLRKAIQGEWMLILAGIVSVVFAILVFMFPGAGALALVWMVSFYAIVSGVLLLALGVRMKGRTPSGGKTTGTPGGSKDRLVGA